MLAKKSNMITFTFYLFYFLKKGDSKIRGLVGRKLEENEKDQISSECAKTVKEKNHFKCMPLI